MAKNEHLGEFEQLALLAVLRLGAEAYGATIQEELDRTAGRSTAISSIYITLTRLESKGLVRSTMQAPGGGRPRRYFTLEPDGVRALKASRDALMSMWSGMERELETT